MSDTTSQIPPHVWTLDSIQAGQLVKEEGVRGFKGLYMIVRRGNGQNHQRVLQYQWGLVSLLTGDDSVGFFKGAFVTYLNRIKPVQPTTWATVMRELKQPSD